VHKGVKNLDVGFNTVLAHLLEISLRLLGLMDISVKNEGVKYIFIE
jgi:hypothetical protein